MHVVWSSIANYITSKIHQLTMVSSNQNSHLLSYSLAGVLGIAFYFWRSKNSHENRKDRDANVLFNDNDWERMLNHYSSGLSESSSMEAGGKDCIYLDYNATTPIYPDVLYAMMPYFTTHYGNPSSGHVLGQEPRRAVEQARTTILRSLLGAGSSADSSAIWFTACGTESDNLAIHLALQCTSGKKFQDKPHIVTSNVEHPAVSVCLEALEKEGRIKVTYVPVQTNGCIRAEDVIQALTDDTVLVTLMLANNESGALQPVRDVAQACRRNGILMHTDAAQAAGKVSVQLKDLGEPDMVSLVGHKMGAPKGIAVLYVRPKCLSENGRSLPHNHGIMLLGGGQEFGRRGGTENVPYIVGMAKAAELAAANLPKNSRHMENMRNRLLQKLESNLKESGIAIHPNGPSDPKLRLPNTLSVGLENIHSGELLDKISHEVAASAGATCHSTEGVSSVLSAMKVPHAFARGTLRLTVGPRITRQDIDQAADVIARAAIEQAQANVI